MDRDTDTTNRSLKSGHFIDVKYFEKRFLFTLKMAIELLKLYLELTVYRCKNDEYIPKKCDF